MTSSQNKCKKTQKNINISEYLNNILAQVQTTKSKSKSIKIKRKKIMKGECVPERKYFNIDGREFFLSRQDADFATGQKKIVYIYTKERHLR